LLCFLHIGPSAADRTILRIISDLHIGSPWFIEPKNHEILTSFLTELTLNTTNVKQFVLLGDAIEMWLYPFSEIPNSASTILSSTNLYNSNVQAYMQLFRQIVDNGVEFHIVIGNHDLELKNAVADLKSAISDKIIVHENEYLYNNGDVRMEHGHRYDLFNAPLNGKRPVGYYVSRAVSEVNYGDGSGDKALTITLCRKIPQFLSDEVILLLRNSLLFGKLLEKMFDQVLEDYDDYKNDIVRGGRWDYNTSLPDETLKQSKEHYDDLVSDWRDYWKSALPNLDEDDPTLGMVKAGCGDNKWWVKQLANPVIVFGHTHEPISPTEYDNFNDGKTTYVNSGAWIDGASMTYVDIVENDESYDVNLVKYSEDSGSTTGTKSTTGSKTTTKQKTTTKSKRRRLSKPKYRAAVTASKNVKKPKRWW
jgi:UDP-2,3-diacylglucosamine pyrophosphatase LpxH